MIPRSSDTRKRAPGIDILMLCFCFACLENSSPKESLRLDQVEEKKNNLNKDKIARMKEKHDALMQMQQEIKERVEKIRDIEENVNNVQDEKIKAADDLLNELNEKFVDDSNLSEKDRKTLATLKEVLTNLSATSS